MDIDEFWSLIERSDSAPDQEEGLRALLRGRSREDLVDFERIFADQLARTYRWDLWGAGYVINGGMSDDSFDYFRYWLIGRGREVFERALADPDSLADVPAALEGDLEAEGLWGAGIEAYEQTYDEEMPIEEREHPDEPAGEEWDDDDLDRLFPRLSAKFGP